jgi:hypothetical protein
MTDITAEILAGQPDEATVNAFYSALAKAITSWQRVEMMLFIVFEKTVFSYVEDQRNDMRALAAAFHGLQHFNSQLQLTDNAVRTRLHHAHYMPELKIPSAPGAGMEELWNEMLKKPHMMRTRLRTRKFVPIPR